jgi:hypothetical protein
VASSLSASVAAGSASPSVPQAEPAAPKPFEVTEVLGKQANAFSAAQPVLRTKVESLLGFAKADQPGHAALILRAPGLSIPSEPSEWAGKVSDFAPRYFTKAGSLSERGSTTAAYRPAPESRLNASSLDGEICLPSRAERQQPFIVVKVTQFKSASVINQTLDAPGSVAAFVCSGHTSRSGGTACPP